jgi:hypothetical protein
MPGASRASAFDLVLVGGAVHPAETAEAPAARDLKAPHRPGCATERWAGLVLKVREADADPKTLRDWAAFVGMSQSSLCECCRIVDVQPHAARDLARLLRAVSRSSEDGIYPAMLLDVSDRRTLRRLMALAGIDERQPVSVDAFLDRQRLIPRTSAALVALRRLIRPS